jgi:hypothetical protein
MIILAISVFLSVQGALASKNFILPPSPFSSPDCQRVLEPLQQLEQLRLAGRDTAMMLLARLNEIVFSQDFSYRNKPMVWVVHRMYSQAILQKNHFDAEALAQTPTPEFEQDLELMTAELEMRKSEAQTAYMRLTYEELLEEAQLLKFAAYPYAATLAFLRGCTHVFTDEIEGRIPEGWEDTVIAAKKFFTDELPLKIYLPDVWRRHENNRLYWGDFNQISWMFAYYLRFNFRNQSLDGRPMTPEQALLHDYEHAVEIQNRDEIDLPKRQEGESALSYWSRVLSLLHQRLRLVHRFLVMQNTVSPGEELRTDIRAAVWFMLYRDSGQYPLQREFVIRHLREESQMDDSFLVSLLAQETLPGGYMYGYMGLRARRQLSQLLRNSFLDIRADYKAYIQTIIEEMAEYLERL